MINCCLSKTTTVLGIFGLGVNFGTCLCFNIFPSYFCNVLGYSITDLANLEILVAFTNIFSKMLGSFVVDKTKTTKKWLLLGIFLLLLGNIGLTYFSAFFAICASRLVERLGNGLYNAPRSINMLACASNSDDCSWCYSFISCMKSMGSLLGCFFSVYLLYLSCSYHFIFLIGLAFFVFSFLCILLGLDPQLSEKYLTTSAKTSKEKVFVNLLRSGLKKSDIFFILILLFVYFLISPVSVLIVYLEQNSVLPVQGVLFWLVHIGAIFCSYVLGKLRGFVSNVRTFCSAVVCLYSFYLLSLFWSDTFVVFPFLVMFLSGCVRGLLTSRVEFLLLHGRSPKVVSSILSINYLGIAIITILKNSFLSGLSVFMSGNFLFFAEIVAFVLVCLCFFVFRNFVWKK